MNNVHNRLANVRAALLGCLRVKLLPFVGPPGGPIRLKPDAGQEAFAFAAQVQRMDASVPASPLE